MNITTQVGQPLDSPADVLIIPAFATDGELDRSGLVAAADDALGGELVRAATGARFSGKRGTSYSIPTFGRLAAGRIVLAGVGGASGVTAESVRRAWGVATKVAQDNGASTVVSAAPPTGDDLDATHALAAAVEGALLATYRFTKYHGAARKDDPAPRDIASLTFTGSDIAGEGLALGQAVADGVSLARDLVNEPASTLFPESMAEHARRVASEHGLDVQVFGRAELEAMGAGGLVNVGKGSVHEPRLIHLTYRPEGATADTKQLGLVGKCITFDTGGYSIKPYDGMLEMKGDMAGGAAVLGAMAALRACGCQHIVHGVICAAENMISGEAFRPGDILTAMNGVTMEILSTDAEGRLVLADGLVYTARQGAQEMVDLATLTGAIVVALGDGTAGLFCNNDDLAGRLEGAAKAAGERVWRMPLTEELKEQIKGDIGDIKNTGGRSGGAITAALFLQYFSEGLPWAHLDIAGCNRASKPSAYTPKGATGWGVRTLLEYVTRS